MTGAGKVDISPDPRPWDVENVDRISYPLIFITPLDECIRISNGDRGSTAIG